MNVAVTDANIFIDLAKLEMINYLFSLGLNIYTTQEVIDQLNEAQAVKVIPFIKSGTLAVHKFSAEEIIVIQSLKAPRALEFTDVTVAYLAKEINALVLTGDGALRKYCISLQMEVRGILWLFDECVNKQIFDHSIALQKLKALAALNDRLPKDEIAKRLEKWERG